MKALKLSPPEVTWTPELRWVLARAFGPADRPFREPFDTAEASRLAKVFDLAPRIGARTPKPILASDLGAEAQSFRRSAHVTVARNLFLVEAVRTVAHVAAKAEIPFVLLKGLALEARQLVPPGSRPTGDLDLLVPVRLIPKFRALLLEAGWTPSGYPDQEHHVDPLSHPRWGEIEIHRVMPGVRPPGRRRSFDYDALASAGLTQSIPDLPEAVKVPADTVLLAHILVHGLVQHGRSPHTYPLFRVLTDVYELAASPGSLQAAGRYLRDVDSDDLAAVRALVDHLGVASATPRWPDPGENASLPEGAAVLLRHIVAGATNRDYVLGLKVRFSVDPFSDLPVPLAVLRAAWRALILTRRQIDEVYGAPRSSLGYLGRRVARPFDLAWRSARSLASLRRS